MISWWPGIQVWNTNRWLGDTSTLQKNQFQRFSEGKPKETPFQTEKT